MVIGKLKVDEDVNWDEK